MQRWDDVIVNLLEVTSAPARRQGLIGLLANWRRTRINEAGLLSSDESQSKEF
jgi:hypothetical protein